MPRREAKRYLSRVNIMEEDGVRHNVEIEVNHPARVGSWRVYQVGYDTSKGRWSDTSVLECIRDPWYGAAHVALWLLLVAGVVMFITAGGRRTGAKKRPYVRPVTLLSALTICRRLSVMMAPLAMEVPRGVVADVERR